MMRTRQSGMTLVEVVIALMIIGIAGSTLVGLLATTSQRSGESLNRTRATAIATTYLDEILSRPIAPCTGGGSRASYTCIQQYNGMNREPVADRFGNALPNSASYTVSVTVNSVNMAGALSTQLVTVRVFDSSENQTVLAGIRTNHP